MTGLRGVLRKCVVHFYIRPRDQNEHSEIMILGYTVKGCAQSKTTDFGSESPDPGLGELWDEREGNGQIDCFGVSKRN